MTNRRLSANAQPRPISPDDEPIAASPQRQAAQSSPTRGSPPSASFRRGSPPSTSPHRESPTSASTSRSSLPAGNVPSSHAAEENTTENAVGRRKADHRRPWIGSTDNRTDSSNHGPPSVVPGTRAQGVVHGASMPPDTRIALRAAETRPRSGSDQTREAGKRRYANRTPEPTTTTHARGRGVDANGDGNKKRRIDTDSLPAAVDDEREHVKSVKVEVEEAVNKVGRLESAVAATGGVMSEERNEEWKLLKEKVKNLGLDTQLPEPLKAKVNEAISILKNMKDVARQKVRESNISMAPPGSVSRESTVPPFVPPGPLADSRKSSASVAVSGTSNGSAGAASLPLVPPSGSRPRPSTNRNAPAAHPVEDIHMTDPQEQNHSSQGMSSQSTRAPSPTPSAALTQTPPLSPVELWNISSTRAPAPAPRSAPPASSPRATNAPPTTSARNVPSRTTATPAETGALAQKPIASVRDIVDNVKREAAFFNRIKKFRGDRLRKFASEARARRDSQLRNGGVLGVFLYQEQEITKDLPQEGQDILRNKLLQLNLKDCMDHEDWFAVDDD